MRSTTRALLRVKEDAASCTRCPLYRNATQTVFGDGPASAAIMLVGEQPGDREDLAGAPFVGPAGRTLDAALDAAELPRDEIYVTNAVKHFKNEPRGKRRLHKRPTVDEIDICRWWLERELDIVKPRVVVALGATAARSLLGRPVTITSVRGRPIPLGTAQTLLVTIHPSLILRMPRGTSRAREFDRFVADLAAVPAVAGLKNEREG